MTAEPPPNGQCKRIEVDVETIPKIRLNIGADVERLGQFEDRFVFFTPALLYLYGGFNDKFLSAFRAEQNREIPFYFTSFDRPLFRGLRNTLSGWGGWNHILWAIDREWFNKFDHHLLTQLVQPAPGTVCRYVRVDYAIKDPVYRDRATIDPMLWPSIDIPVYGVVYSKRSFLLSEAEPFDLNILVPPEGDTECQIAEAALRGDDIDKLVKFKDQRIEVPDAPFPSPEAGDRADSG